MSGPRAEPARGRLAGILRTRVEGDGRAGREATHGVDHALEEQEPLRRHADAAADYDAIPGLGDDTAIVPSALASVPDGAEPRLPAPPRYVLHRVRDPGLDRLGRQPRRQIRVGGIDGIGREPN